jgi:hypothetical protein
MSCVSVFALVYHGIMVTIERVQSGVRMERRLLKVLKGLAEYLDVSLGDLLEGIVLHAFEQKLAFDDATVVAIERLKEVYGLDLTATDSHHLCEVHDKGVMADAHRTRAVDRHGRDRSSSGTSLHDVHTEW